MNMKSQFRKLITFLIVIYLMILMYWMLLGFGRTPQEEYMYNLKPFVTIGQFLQVSHFTPRAWMVNLLGNIGVFVPFGVLMPVVFRMKLLKVYGLFLAGLITLELTQLLSKRGSLDVDDVILNSLGFLIGYGIYKAAAQYFKTSL
ncbi:VanZ family protein [Paenibacillus brevis]